MWHIVWSYIISNNTYKYQTNWLDLLVYTFLLQIISFQFQRQMMDDKDIDGKH